MAESVRWLKVGDSVGIYEITHVDDRRLRLAVPLGFSLVMLLIGAASLAFDLMLLHAGFRLRVIQIFPRIVQIILIIAPLLAVFSLFLIGRSYDFDTAAGRAEARKMYVFAKTFPTADVASVLLQVTTPSRSSVVELKLLDRQGNPLLSEFRAELDGKEWPFTLYLAAELSRILRCPIKIDGEPKEAWPNAITAIDEIRRTGIVPTDIRVIL